MSTEIVHQKSGQINIVLHNKNKAANEKKQNKVQKNSPFFQIEQEFSSFIGMEKLKEKVKEIYAQMIINEKRKQNGLQSSKQVLHMLFKGNPGTGKTTVARSLANIYYEMNLLTKGHFIEADRADLVGEYIGQTAQKTRSIIQKAMGGVLFIDEAYSLARGGEKDFGKESIDMLVKCMEDNQNNFVLILAGYPYEMEHFLNLNPGLRSRFPFILDFEDYSTNHLVDIAIKMFDDREYKLTQEAEWKLHSHLLLKKQQNEYNFSNARYVRNIVEQAIRIQAMRLLNNNSISVNDLVTLTASDFQFDYE